MQRIEDRLRLGMGLDAETIGSSSLHRVIRLRMKAAKVATVGDYERLLNTSATEWNHLVEAVVITETWFFRDRQAFGALTSSVITDWLPAHPAGRVNILSLPCSSGEEPCSIAMALLDAGVVAGRFSVHGVDLSSGALEKAAAGLYGKNSFRGQDFSFRDRHFKREGELYSINQSIRDCVTFQQTNLLSDAFSIGRASYDFIFCRNLLIYFDRATQRQAFARLQSLLVRGGILFVGPAEVPLAMENGFTAINSPMAFACRRADETTLTRRTASAHRIKTAPAPMVKPQPPVTAAKLLTKNSSKAEPVDLDAARTLADGGKFDEATRVCHAHLDRHGASVHVYYLLGVIHDAQGNPTAREFYRKALYLDPNHYETLLQMASHAEKDGDSEAARNLRRRATKGQSQPA